MPIQGNRAGRLGKPWLQQVPTLPERLARFTGAVVEAVGGELFARSPTLGLSGLVLAQQRS
jgi:hypothetical protein